MSALYLSAVDEEELKKGLAYLDAKATPPDNKSPFYYYTQFHLTTAMRYAGNEPFRRWYEPSCEQLLSMQADDGSWPLKNWDSEYATAKACVALLAPRIPVVRSAESP